ncbi:RNA polymerase sigma factor, partial [Singulisphaera rosea]
MVRRNSSQVLWAVSRLFDEGTVSGAGEDQLLQRFVSAHDEVAFEVLVRRHGPMVWSVCRRLLRDPHDAEDAFQATFLVLARKAGSIRERQFLGTWLYGVAYRVAARSRRDIETRRRRECHSRDDVPSVVAFDDAEVREVRSLLDDEIGRLPERYRTPVVLHYFQGWTHLQIAEQLACPVGTVHSRLTRARDRLRGRLASRGLEPDAAVVPSRARTASRRKGWLAKTATRA